MKTIKLLVLSDTHVGHLVGLWPYFKECNGPQRYLLKCFNEIVDEAKQSKIDILVVNGDLIDGEQRKSGGTEATTALVGHQQTACIDLLTPLAELAKERYFTRGTPYHDGPLGALTEPIAKALGGTKTGTGDSTATTWDLDISGVRCNFHHEIAGGGGNLSRGAQLTKEAIFAHLACPEQIDLLVRSHLHYFAHSEFHNSHAVITPAWELATPYMNRKSPYRMVPDIGAVFIDIHPEDNDPIVVKKRLFPLPVQKPVRSLA